MTELAEAIGLGDDLITNQTGQSYIYANNRLYPFQAVLSWGFLLMLNHLSVPN